MDSGDALRRRPGWCSRRALAGAEGSDGSRAGEVCGSGGQHDGDRICQGDRSAAGAGGHVEALLRTLRSADHSDGLSAGIPARHRRASRGGRPRGHASRLDALLPVQLQRPAGRLRSGRLHRQRPSRRSSDHRPAWRRRARAPCRGDVRSAAAVGLPPAERILVGVRCGPRARHVPRGRVTREASIATNGAAKYVGAALSPRETRKLCLGRGSYVGHLTAPGLRHAAVGRSPHAHALIRGVNVTKARQSPGVVAVLTGEDLARATVPLRIAPPIEGLLPMEMPTLPTDKVRFVGDPIACVIGEDRYQVEDACGLVEVEYERLAAVVDPERARNAGLPRVDAVIPANCPYAGIFAHGDVESALRAARRVVEARFHQGRQTHAPMEPRGCLASWLPGDDTLTFWHSTQIPHPMRTALAARLGIAESAVRVITPDVGGGFGQKIPLYREELATAAASRLLGRPVRWIETRRENLLAALHAREDIVDVRAAVKADGTILGLDVKILADFGAYAYFPANYMARVVGMMIPGAYRLRDYRYAITAVLTNKCPSGPYRAPMLICSWVTEGTVEAVARALGLDSVEVRRRNMLAESDLPYGTATELTYRSVYPRDTLERALAAFDYTARRREQRAARSAGRIVGIGVAT